MYRTFIPSLRLALLLWSLLTLSIFGDHLIRHFLFSLRIKNCLKIRGVILHGHSLDS